MAAGVRLPDSLLSIRKPASKVLPMTPTSDRSEPRPNQPLRILHVITAMDPKLGGPPPVAAALTSTQAALGHEVALAFHPTKPGSPEPLAQSTPGFSRVREVLFERPAGRLQSLTAAHTAATLEREIAYADIVHLHGVWEPLLLRASVIARRLRKPYVVLPNGMLKHWALATKPMKKRIALAMGYRKMLRGAAAIHTLNEEERSELSTLGLVDRAFVLPNGVWPLTDVTLPAPGTFRRTLPALGDAPLVLFVGRLHPIKGTDILAKAFDLLAARHPTVQLVTAGPDAGELASLTAHRAASPFRDRFHLVGPLYNDDKLAALVDATVFCLSSRQEAFPVAVLDALGVALPVVISRTCHFPQVHTAGAGRVCELEPVAIADALFEVVSNPALRQSMSERAIQLVADYQWPQIGRNCVELYRTILVRSAAPARVN